MDKKNNLIPENMSGLEANFAGHLVKFEEIRGFL
jgi:hypothetical protein